MVVVCANHDDNDADDDDGGGTPPPASFAQGSFDKADRLFRNLGAAFASASGVTSNVMHDVKELIPEFYYNEDFLGNLNHYPLGETQAATQVNEVELPKWAHGSPKRFVQLHRRALESDHVSRHLHEWIDLVFGCKQTGRAAEEAVNVFHYLTYEGSVDLDAVSDPLKRRVWGPNPLLPPCCCFVYEQERSLMCHPLPAAPLFAAGVCGHDQVVRADTSTAVHQASSQAAHGQRWHRSEAGYRRRRRWWWWGLALGKRAIAHGVTCCR